jgi:hypothetical protein
MIYDYVSYDYVYDDYVSYDYVYGDYVSYDSYDAWLHDVLW